MALNRFTPGCCCDGDGGCLLSNDTFDDSGTIDQYTQASGTWNIAGSKLTTSDDSAACFATAQNPDIDFRTTKVSCGIRGTVSGAVLRVCISAQDIDNYLFLEITTGAVTHDLKMFERVAGVETQLGYAEQLASTGATDWITLELCHSSSGGVFASVSQGSNEEIIGAFSNGIGPLCGFATGALGGGSMEIDGLLYEKHHSSTNRDCAFCIPENDLCLTSLCLDDNIPTMMKVVLSGIVTAGCANCNDYNATYYLPQWPGFNCSYYDEFGDTPCPKGFSRSEMVCNLNGSNIYVSFLLSTGIFGGRTIVEFQENYGTQLDCLTISSEALPILAVDGSAGQCDLSASTCTITAIP